MTVGIGETFMIGFRGTKVPEWVRLFASQYGLGGVILFDFDCESKSFGRNIRSPDQVQKLCAEIHDLPGRPLVFIDQEGGKVRRLKEHLGFAPLPSAEEFAALGTADQARVVKKSFLEMRHLGIDFNLAPVVDVNSNPENPDIGKIGRSYGSDIDAISACVGQICEVARDVGLGLCLKHFPGCGGATTNSHDELTDLTDVVKPSHEEIFYRLLPLVPGRAILISHGFVKTWDSDLPASMSTSIIQRIRKKSPDALIISDDLQMQGLQKRLNSIEATYQGLRAGIDMLIFGNNLIYEEELLWKAADEIQNYLKKDSLLRQRVEEAGARVQVRKKTLI